MTRCLLPVLLLLVGCGVQAHEGRVRIPLDGGQCDMVVCDTLLDEPVRKSGPLEPGTCVTGTVCEVYRW